ncbi:BglG family transcription antiterminator [Streptococcus tangpeifui]|uniref:BglG family transcription antiterminator n=1 Tax=Streptococcus tangpeifui TaxID=2709400 RepID=UPI0013ED0091|nr:MULTISPECIES: PRD domain-containing protein [unclassified Streptococcus]
MVESRKKIDELLFFLSQQSDYMTASQLAQALGKSEKTIYRMIKSLNQEHSGQLIVSRKGRGYWLNQEKYLTFTQHSCPLHDDLTVENRQELILERLLLRAPKGLALYDLCQDYFVSESVIQKDKLELQKLLNDYQLRLLSRRRILSIHGEEQNIRRAIADLVPTFRTIDLEQLSLEKDQTIDREVAGFIQAELHSIEQHLQAVLPYPYDVNVFSHLYIMIMRSKNGKVFLGTHQSLQNFEEMNFLMKESWRVIQDVREKLGISVDDSEVYHLYQYLMASHFQDIHDSAPIYFSQRTLAITHFYFEQMFPDRGQAIMEDSPIFVDLANHISPMLRRLDHKIRIKNAMLSDIRLTYPKIFNQVRRVSEVVSQRYGFPTINLDEVGFITLYFARYQETQSPPIPTLIMCTSGIGTSELLRSKIEQQFGDLAILSVLPYRDLADVSRQYPEAQLLITTVNVAIPENMTKILVSALMTEDDQRRIRRKIEEIRYGH